MIKGKAGHDRLKNRLFLRSQLIFNWTVGAILGRLLSKESRRKFPFDQLGTVIGTEKAPGRAAFKPPGVVTQ